MLSCSSGAQQHMPLQLQIINFVAMYLKSPALGTLARLVSTAAAQTTPQRKQKQQSKLQGITAPARHAGHPKLLIMQYITNVKLQMGLQTHHCSSGLVCWLLVLRGVACSYPPLLANRSIWPSASSKNLLSVFVYHVLLHRVAEQQIDAEVQ